MAIPLHFSILVGIIIPLAPEGRHTTKSPYIVVLGVKQFELLGISKRYDIVTPIAHLVRALI